MMFSAVIWLKYCCCGKKQQKTINYDIILHRLVHLRMFSGDSSSLYTRFDCVSTACSYCKRDFKKTRSLSFINQIHAITQLNKNHVINCISHKLHSCL